MKDGDICKVLFCNDSALAVYGNITEKEQEKVLNAVKAKERRSAQQQYGNPDAVNAEGDKINPHAKADIESHLFRMYFHFHDVRFKSV